MPLKSIYKVVVVEDEPAFLENTIQKIKDTSTFFEIAGSAKNGLDAIEVIQAFAPDVVFTDIRMPRMDGLELIKRIKDIFPNMYIVVLSGYSDFEYAQQAIKLGVTEYLLKPLKIDTLKDVLESIKDRLDSMTSITERDILFSGLNDPFLNNNLPSSFKYANFSILLLSIGHLCNQIISNTQARFFSEAWDKIDWRFILPQDIHWWIIDENKPNQKFLILSSDSFDIDLHLFALRVKESLSTILAPLPVNICTNITPISYVDIWPKALDLRMHLDQCLVLGKSAVFTTSAVHSANMPPAILDMVFQNKILTLINHGNMASLQRELYVQFEKWEKAGYPQRWIEKVLHQLIKIFHRQFCTISEDEISQMEYEFKDKLVISTDLSSLYEDVWSIFNSILISTNNEKYDVRELINNVESYIINNYTSDIDIESIARKFNINPTYLAKLFKKFLNDTPAKYIIKQRINKAKHLIKNNPEFDIKEIGEIVGYIDQHYFSRIFKETTGVSPTMYRKSLFVEDLI